MDNLDKTLEKLGLSLKEKKIYKLILETGKIAPAFISRKTGINRTTVYSVAGELKSRGLIVEDLGGKTLYYLPAGDSEIEKILEQDKKNFADKEQGLYELKEVLKIIPQSKTFSIPKIRFIAEDDLEKYLYDATPRWIESNLTNESTWWGFQDHTFVENYQQWIGWYWKHAPDEIKLKMFSNDSAIESQMITEKLDRRQIKFWKGNEHITGTQWITGSYIVLIVTAQKPFYLVEIHDSVMAHNMARYSKHSGKSLKINPLKLPQKGIYLYCMKKYLIFTAIIITTLLIGSKAFAANTTLSFRNISSTSAEVYLNLGDDMYRTLVNNKSTISIQYWPGCPTTANTGCNTSIPAPSYRTFGYTDDVVGPMPIVLNGLQPNTPYYVNLGYDNGVRCITAPCPSTEWQSPSYSFTTTSGSVGSSTRLSFVTLSSTSVRVNITVENDQYRTALQNRLPIKIQYRPWMCGDDPTTAPYTACPMIYIQPNTATFAYDANGGISSITLINLQPNTKYRVWLGYDKGWSCGANPCVSDEWDNGRYSFSTGSGSNPYPTNQILTQKLYFGVRGTQVNILENFLASQGYMNSYVDTYFGTVTHAAVARFQVDHGYRGDGVVGPITRALINQMINNNPSVYSSVSVQ